MTEKIYAGKMPILALRGLAVFPDQTVHFDVGRPKSIRALEAAMKQDQTLLLIPQKDMQVDDPKLIDLYSVGTVAKVKQVLKTQGDNLRVLVTGICRGKIAELYGMGLYLMKQFMDQLPNSLMESARLDGASEFRVFLTIVMPNVKPAWLTLAIFQFQQMWGNTGAMFLRDEELKPLQFALQQIAAGGTARAGASAAVTFIIAAIPITFFLICQSNVLETMTTSGMKE